MRLALAVFLIVLGAVAGTAGYLQKTLWAPSDTLTATATLQDPGPLIVVDPGVMNLYETPAKLTVTGTGPLVVTQASAENVNAWVGSAAHTDITGLKSANVLATKKTTGDATVPDPKDGDLWENQTVGEGHLQVAWDHHAGRTSWLIASDGESPAPAKISISWPADASTPWAIPLMLAGAILLIIGLILITAWFYDITDRRRRRKARTSRRRAVTQAGTTLMVIGALGLAGCGAPPELPRPSPSATATSAGPVVNSTQLERVLTEISAAVAQGDASNDVSKLGDRVTGPALEVRTAAYAVRKKASDVALPSAIAASPIQLNLTTASDNWPRVTTVVTQKGDATPQFMNLLQKDARSPYQLYSVTDLLPGVTIPPTPDPKIGATLLSGDESSLKMTPQDVAKQYAVLLTGGKAGKAAQAAFAPDAYSADLLKYQQSQSDAAEKAKGTAKFTHTAQSGDLVATSTVDGGALVTAYITSETQIKPQVANGLKGEISIPDPEAKLIGKKTTTKGVKVDYGQTFLFYVPKDKTKQVEVLGASETLLKASEL